MAAVAQFYVTYIGPVIRVGMALFAILVLWVALWRAGFASKARVLGFVSTALLLVCWGATDQLGRSRFYPPNWSVMRSVGWIIAIAGLIPLLRSQPMGAALPTIPAWCPSAAPPF